MSNVGSALDTFPKLARANAERMARHVAIREKDLGIWQSHTWREYFERSRRIALGLASLGFARGDKTAIVGDNRPELYWAALATQALGGVPVPLYQDSIEKELAYIVDHAEARFAVAEDQEQVDKLLHVRAQCPRLEYIVYDDARGHARLLRARACSAWPSSRSAGEKFALGHPDVLRRRGRARARRRRRRDHLLHVGDHRRAQGRDAVPPKPDRRRRATPPRARGSARRRGDPVLPADGVGRRPHLLVRAVHRHRLHDRTARRARPPCCTT